uniref:C-type lectin domain-containing protein n=1 Tax=Panagrolaimus sp. JU765 TaxID=591449 RepID=A0AC34RR66_9BILA
MTGQTWIGLVYNAGTNTWSWLDGTPVDYPAMPWTTGAGPYPWSAGSPDLMDGCVMMITDPNTTALPPGTWNDVPCTSTQATLVCKAPPIFV